MQLQGSFSQAEYAGKKKQTRRDKFLAEMEQVVPPASAGAGSGAAGGASAAVLPEGRARPAADRSGADAADPLPAAVVWAGRGAMEDALYDSQALRGFAGIDLTVASVPEETTILNFRHWLEQHELSQALFA